VNLGALNVEIWLFILQSGDWWTPMEIDGQFKFKAGTSYRQLHNMERMGTLEKKVVQGTRSVKFAVTGTCAVPRGIPVGKVQVRILAGERPPSAARPAPARSATPRSAPPRAPCGRCPG
jgi:hypothetical protein